MSDVREDGSDYSYTMLLTETPDGEVKIRVPVEDVRDVLDMWEDLVVALGYGSRSNLAVVYVSKVVHGVDMGDVVNPDQSTIYDHLGDIHDEVGETSLDG